MQPQAPGVSMAKIFYILESVWSPPNTCTHIFQNPLCTCLWTDFNIYHNLPKPVYTLGWKMGLNILWQSLPLYKTEWGVDTSEGRAPLKEDLDKVGDWYNRKIMKFNKDKCKVLHLGKHNAEQQHRLGSTQQGTSSVEKGPGGPWWTTSSVWVNCVFLQQRKPTGCRVTSTRTSPAEVKKVVIPLYSDTVLWINTRQSQGPCSCLVTPHQWDQGEYSKHKS